MKKLLFVLVLVLLVAIVAAAQTPVIRNLADFGQPVADDRPVVRPDGNVRTMGVENVPISSSGIPGGLIRVDDFLTGRTMVFFSGSLPSQSAMYRRIYFGDGQILRFQGYWFETSAGGTWNVLDINPGSSGFSRGPAILEVSVSTPQGTSNVSTYIFGDEDIYYAPKLWGAVEFPTMGNPSVVSIYGNFIGATDGPPRIFMGLREVPQKALVGWGLDTIQFSMSSDSFFGGIQKGIIPLTVCYRNWCGTTMMVHRVPAVSIPPGLGAVGPQQQ